MAIAVVINVIGAFIAVNFKIPILLLDAIGTILISFLYGSKYGILVGFLGAIVSGISFDIYALYFSPVQIVVGYLSGYLYKKNRFKGKKIFLGVFIISLFSSLVGAIIAGYVFEGVTSSGSTYLVKLFEIFGLNTITSVFLVQFVMDYVDRCISVFIALSFIKKLKEIR